MILFVSFYNVENGLKVDFPQRMEIFALEFAVNLVQIL
jgi:hypothetical protein